MSVVVASYIGRKGQSSGGEGVRGSEARRSFHTIVFLRCFYHVLHHQNPFKCTKKHSRSYVQSCSGEESVLL